MEKEYVWYACYGSNLSREKFVERYISRCSDKTPPMEDRPYILHYPLYFAGNSGQWHGGVAFIGTGRDERAYTLGRVYKITPEQLLETQKNESLKPHWYGNRLNLGTLGDLPVYTLTRDPAFDFTEPRYASAEYLDIIRQGLSETYPGLDADAYLGQAARFTESLVRNGQAEG